MQAVNIITCTVQEATLYQKSSGLAVFLVQSLNRRFFTIITK